MAHVGRVDNSDGQFSIWNVSWVAHALLTAPWHVYDANIFYPHRWTLAYSESNLGAGILAVPVYWATRNPILSLNVVMVLAFILSGCGTYYLVRHLTGDRYAAMMSAICFAFCPYVFGRLSHIQLLMTAGLPFSMLALHRVMDRPGRARAVTLGAVIAAQATCCGYYAIFVALMVGLAIVITTTMRGQWTNRSHWTAIVTAGVVSVVLAAPLFAPYALLQRTTGFARPLDDAVRYSADWRAYLASSAIGHDWMLPLIGRWNEVLFPGFVATFFGLAGVVVGWVNKGRQREAAVVYGTLAVAAFWASFGPDAKLYTVLYRVIPLFVWLRAPARFGVIVALALAVLAGLTASGLLKRVGQRGAQRVGILATALILVTAAELATPLHLREAAPVSPASRLLATLPPGPVIELPFFYRPQDLHGHAEFMLESTAHWMPLINGYSDYIPEEFADGAETMHVFPSVAAFKLVEPRHPKYVMYHMNIYGEADRADMAARLREFSRYLHPLYVDGQTELYEIVGFPE